MFSSQNSQVSNDVNYIEDVFSTYLYDGNSSSQVINNGINLAGKGGLVWMKNRGSVVNHGLMDTARGTSSLLCSNLTDAEKPYVDITSFNSNGFTLGFYSGWFNSSGGSYASWTFRKQPKFFDVVTYTGNGVNNRAIPHNLGSTPGCIIVKTTSAASQWIVYHRSLPTQNILYLSLNVGIGSALPYFPTNPDSNNFYVGESGYTVNDSGETYVAYIFAHNAGGFGLTGTDNVISCGTFTTDGTGAAGNITLGYESQLVMFKRSDGVGNWQIVDTMRGSSLTSYNYISPTVSNAESSSTSAGQGIYPTATGFYVGNNFPGANQTYVYMAIRRGPMKVPTLGTSVFSPLTRTGTGATAVATYGFATDLVIPVNRPHDATGATPFFDKLRGVNQAIYSNSTSAEENRADTFVFSNTGVTFGTNSIGNSSGASYVNWAFQRAPGFFDEVCYTGTGSSNTISHNLTVTPELIISKQRSGVNNWLVSSPSLGKAAYLNTVDAFSASYVVYGSVTSASFTALYSGSIANGSGQTYVAYLFATCPGVSKVGTYTGTAAAQTINCGFTSGARFVLIKRFDAQPDTTSGPWYVWDSARGITSGNDPYLLLNSTGAEVTSLNYVDTDATGFKLTTDSGPQKALNDSGGTYIFLAIA